jgi:hypothetical protein
MSPHEVLRVQRVWNDLLSIRYREIPREEAVGPESFTMSGTLPKLLRREAGMSPHLSDHVCLIGKPPRRGELRPIDFVLLEGLV